jgi:RNA-directed DNA polymerase
MFNLANQTLLTACCNQLLANPWDEKSIEHLLKLHITKPHRWLSSLAKRIVNRFPIAPDSVEELRTFVLSDRLFAARWKSQSFEWIRVYLPLKPRDLTALHDWPIPKIMSVVNLAKWLNLSYQELCWFADLKSLNPTFQHSRLDHYRRFWIPKSSGRFRLLEAPKQRLKALQRKILDDLLSNVPPHDACKGFQRGQSISTYVEPHVGKPVVWRLDLKDFFPSITGSRVHATFHRLGYSHEVSRFLTGLCTTTIPKNFPTHSHTEGLIFRNPHLPQGAPTSPALANLCSYNLDLRLSAYAAKSGVAYSRYADDLAFSGDQAFSRAASAFRRRIFQIIFEERFRPNAAKSRWMFQCQRQKLTGVVINEKPNVTRVDFDRLKAILFNAIRFGLESQNRDNHPNFRAYLLGKISFISSLNPDRGSRLRKMYDQITT